MFSDAEDNTLSLSLVGYEHRRECEGKEENYTIFRMTMMKKKASTHLTELNK
jgi:hypothetical protein